MSVTAPSGFEASGIAAGLKASGRLDLGLLAAERPVSAAGLFTTNAFAAAPVALSRRHLGSGRARAVVVNSGQANAATGEDGAADAAATASAAAELLGAEAEDVVVCSTGVIGPRVKMPELLAGLPRAAAALSPDGGEDFATAILTTDAASKQAVAGGGGLTVGGCVKGAGMIAPDLATLLCFLTTDAEVAPDVLDGVLRRAAAPVWNALTVDGCSSTNDAVVALASGASRIRAEPGTPALEDLERAVAEVTRDLARLTVGEAEGATTALAVHVRGAVSDGDARAVARAVCGSLLVKTAVFGGDPNPGRLLQAVGAAGASVEPSRVTIRLAGHTVAAAGRITAFDRAACAEALKEREVAIAVELGLGEAEATSFGCDLGYEYVRINAEYTT